MPVEPPDAAEVLPDVKSSMPDGLYQRAVEVAKEHIVAGDIFQVVLAQRYDLDLDADPFDVYRVLRQVNPSPYMYFVRHPELTIVGSSPEPMVQVLDGRVISRPIAGTRKRGSTDEHDRRLAAELTEHPKERAEHVMLVDLARNDVGRVARFGTVHVDELMTLERYSHVMHLTSQVSGDLVDGLGPIDVLRATLPAGTVSGAPKVRAMEIIDELEPVKRGPYAGVVGYVDWSGNLDTAIAIRTMFVRPDRCQPAGRRRHRRRLRSRRRGPRVPQQGGRPARRGAGGPAHDGRPPRRTADRPDRAQGSASSDFIRAISTCWSELMCWASWKIVGSCPPVSLARSCSTMTTAPSWWAIIASRKARSNAGPVVAAERGHGILGEHPGHQLAVVEVVRRRW